MKDFLSGKHLRSAAPRTGDDAIELLFAAQECPLEACFFLSQGRQDRRALLLKFRVNLRKRWYNLFRHPAQEVPADANLVTIPNRAPDQAPDDVGLVDVSGS